MSTTKNAVTPSHRRRIDFARPLNTRESYMILVGAFAIYLAIAQLLGGPTQGDAAESAYSTWAIAHGHLACAYPPPSTYNFPNIANPFVLISPLYPLVTGVFAAVLHIGGGVAFPTAAQMGPHCSHAFVAMFKWSKLADPIRPTVLLGYLGWLGLFAGAVAVVRVSKWARTMREAFVLFALALTPPMLMPLTIYFHPQDLLALGLSLIAVAAAVRRRWLAVGVFLGLALTTQQFALLAAIPLLVFIPAQRAARTRVAIGLVGSILLVVSPFIFTTSGRVIRSIVLGSSRMSLFGTQNFRSTGGTVLWETNWRGAGLFLVSRVAPLVLSLLLALWVRRKMGDRVLTPVALSAVLGVSMSLRLVFEDNLFGYYFMALAALLVLMDGLSERFRPATLVWIALVTVAFNPVPIGLASNWSLHGPWLARSVPLLFIVGTMIMLITDIVRRRWRPYLLVAVGIVVWESYSQVSGASPYVQRLPHWAWQLILVPPGAYLCWRRLRLAMNDVGQSEVSDSTESLATRGSGQNASAS